jgi:hypothetical protein
LLYTLDSTVAYLKNYPCVPSLAGKDCKLHISYLKHHQVIDLVRVSRITNKFVLPVTAFSIRKDLGFSRFTYYACLIPNSKVTSVTLATWLYDVSKTHVLFAVSGKLTSSHPCYGLVMALIPNPPHIAMAEMMLCLVLNAGLELTGGKEP